MGAASQEKVKGWVHGWWWGGKSVLYGGFARDGGSGEGEGEGERGGLIPTGESSSAPNLTPTVFPECEGEVLPAKGPHKGLNGPGSSAELVPLGLGVATTRRAADSLPESLPEFATGREVTEQEIERGKVQGEGEDPPTEKQQAVAVFYFLQASAYSLPFSLRDPPTHIRSQFMPSSLFYNFAHRQLFSACLAAFAHGSNDTSHAAGPFSAIFDLWSKV